MDTTRPVPDAQFLQPPGIMILEQPFGEVTGSSTSYMVIPVNNPPKPAMRPPALGSTLSSRVTAPSQDTRSGVISKVSRFSDDNCNHLALEDIYLTMDLTLRRPDVTVKIENAPD